MHTTLYPIFANTILLCVRSLHTHPYIFPLAPRLGRQVVKIWRMHAWRYIMKIYEHRGEIRRVWPVHQSSDCWASGCCSRAQYVHSKLADHSCGANSRTRCAHTNWNDRKYHNAHLYITVGWIWHVLRKWHTCLIIRNCFLLHAATQTYAKPKCIHERECLFAQRSRRSGSTMILKYDDDYRLRHSQDLLIWPNRRGYLRSVVFNTLEIG